MERNLEVKNIDDQKEKFRIKVNINSDKWI